jgi:RNA polymerase sigma factor (sigma-70 family)
VTVSIVTTRVDESRVAIANRTSGKQEEISARPQPCDDRNDPLDGAATVEETRARFAALVLPHLSDAYSLARWITGNRADAEDVVQDACVRAFRAVWSASDGNGRAWTLSVVRHAAYSWLRKNRPVTLVAVDDLEEAETEQVSSWDSDWETPESALIAKLDSESLEAAIAALPAPFRETMILRDVQALSYREIAEVTGVPIGTVMSRLARGRRRVMRAIARKRA